MINKCYGNDCIGLFLGPPFDIPNVKRSDSLERLQILAQVILQSFYFFLL